MATEKLIEVWARRNPDYEIRHEELIIKQFTDFGKGSSGYQESRGKIYGAGYEILIVAFFIGLYHNKRKKLIANSNKIKNLGQPIMYWGNRENRGFRRQYSDIQKYIFTALIARSDIDLIELDKGNLKVSAAVNILMTTMEEYINFGLDYIKDKLEDNPDHFFKNSAFLDVFLSLLPEDNNESDIADVESLD